jgi:L-fuculose-phosphate aldolase
MASVQVLARQIVEYGRRLYERSLVGGTEGNLSVRLTKDKILITPRNKNKGFLKIQDMVVLSTTGKVVSGKNEPSTEYQAHLEVYAQRPDINAVCHAHPLYATGFAVDGIALDKPTLPEIVISLGQIPIADYGTPGTPELARNIRGLIKLHDALLLKNHGVLTVGTNLEEAFNRMETVERYAEIMFAAMLIGKPQQIPANLIKKLPGYEKLQRQIDSLSYPE